MKKEEIIAEIEKYLVNKGVKRYNQCYVGIAKDPKDRLFKGHKVDEHGVWIYCPADTDIVARETEAALIAKGMKGGKGGGNDETDYVYSYLITEQTSESITIDKQEGK